MENLDLDVQSRDFTSESDFFEENSNVQSIDIENSKDDIPYKIHYTLQIFWEITLRVH